MTYLLAADIGLTRIRVRLADTDFRRADLALDEYLAALAQEFAAVLALLPPDDDVVPLGALLTGAVAGSRAVGGS